MDVGRASLTHVLTGCAGCLWRAHFRVRRREGEPYEDTARV